MLRLGEDRFELIVAPEQGPEVWERLSKDAVPVGASCWEWLQIKAGIPMITLPRKSSSYRRWQTWMPLAGSAFRKDAIPARKSLPVASIWEKSSAACTLPILTRDLKPRLKRRR